jgi:hypothetical protein
MRFLRFALCVVCLGVAGLRAADDDDKDNKGPVPEEIPDFSRLDEYIYVPKSTMSLGTRLFLNGPKTSYSGQGAIPSDVGPLADPRVPNVSRTYEDGDVLPDARSVPTTSGVGETGSAPVPSDGRTNSWSYLNNSQVLPNGDIAFHVYSGEVTDTAVQSIDAKSSVGLELILDRDMGKLGKHFKWSMTVGLSLADIHSSTYANVATTQTTITDTYDLYGQVPPAAPFTSPSAVSQSVLNSSGQPVSTTGAATSTQEADQVILLGNHPISETVTPIQTTSENRYFIEGAYYTLRIGPTLIFPMGQHFKLTASVGPDLIYSGSEYNVLEDLIYATNEPGLTQLYQKENTKILPGYYADVNLRYDMTETAGIYVGGIYQGAGSYSQSISSGPGTSYTTKIDFQSEQGVKGGLTVRF